jgi:hypothetical protein
MAYSEEEKLMMLSVMKSLINSGESDDHIRKQFNVESAHEWNEEQLKEVEELKEFCEEFLKEKNNE